MKNAWPSVPSEFPGSVQDLMSMWGGFGAPQNTSDCGIEKRLELDFRGGILTTDVAVEDLEVAMSHAGEVLERHSTESDFVSLQFGNSVVMLTTKQIILTSAASVQLHMVLGPLLRLLHTRGIAVEWACFMRMHTTSPWNSTQENSGIIAREYAELKSAFPSGHPYLIGPLYRDHLFFFVYDAIERGAPDAPCEDDVQINIFMYNAKIDGYDDESGGSGALKSIHQLISHSGSEYEMFRVFPNNMVHPFVSFETNATMAALNRAELVKDLVEKFRPDRFTMLLLQDRFGPITERLNLFNEVEGYTIMNRAANYFGNGYAFHQADYIREE